MTLKPLSRRAQAKGLTLPQDDCYLPGFLAPANPTQAESTAVPVVLDRRNRRKLVGMRAAFIWIGFLALSALVLTVTHIACRCWDKAAIDAIGFCAFAAYLAVVRPRFRHR